MKAQKYTKETICEIGVQDRGFPEFSIGDALVVSLSIKEAGKERFQDFEGDVIAIHRNGASSTFTVRKIAAHAVAVERIFPYGSPLVKNIKVLNRGDVRRAKLYYLRNRVGNAALVTKRIEKKVKAEKKAS